MTNRQIRQSLLALTLALPASAAAQTSVPAAQATPPITARFATIPVEKGEPNMAVVSVDQPSIIGTAELGGLEIYDLDGRRIGTLPAGEAAGVDIRRGVPIAGQSANLLAAIDATTNSLRLFRSEGQSWREIAARQIPLGFAAENVCLHRSGRDGALYAFVVGDGGQVEQLMLFTNPGGQMDARQVRRLTLPSPVNYCVVDDRTGELYVAHETVGIWRFDANPEADAAPVLVDARGPGQITEEVGGVALYNGGPGAHWLIASDASAGRLLVYDRDAEDRFIGAVSLKTADGGELEEPGGLYTSSVASGDAGSSPILLVADESRRNYQAFGIDAIATALRIPSGSPGGVAEPAAAPFPAVRPLAETAPVPSFGDAADDPAIWAHPTDPSRSLVVGTDKRSGLHIYDLQGKVLHFAADGRMNNVDLREGFRLNGREVVLVTASNRTTLGVSIYVLDTESRKLVDVADGIQASGLSDPYGLCMYRSARSGRYYVFVTDPDGLIRQWELVATAKGRVRLRQVRDLQFSSQTEGCVADEAAGVLYVGEEDVGLWRVNAEPRGREARVSVDAVATNPRIKDDIEGVGIYDLGNGRGYIVASSQGNDSYAVYRREGKREYLGSFIVVADGARGIDGISETDGLEVTSRNLGPGFEHGAMIAQDGRNVLPTENQNFKYVSWTDIARALNLEVRQ